MAIRGVVYFVLAFNAALAVAAGLHSISAIQSGRPLYALVLIASVAGAAVALTLIVSIHRSSASSATGQRITIGTRPLPTIEELRANRQIIASRFTEAKNSYDPVVKKWKELLSQIKIESDPLVVSKLLKSKEDLSPLYYSLRDEFYAVKDEIKRVDRQIGAARRAFE